MHLGVGGHRGRPRARHARRRHDDQDALRGLGRRHHGARRWPPRPGCRRAAAGASTSQPDLTVDGCPGVYAIGDVANIPAPDGERSRSSARSRCRAATWAADNILADAAGKPRKPFHYHDKGIMAMIGRGAAIAEVGAHRHELHGVDRLLGLAGRARRR